ncbi:MAG: glycosyltransferase family 2 protein [Chitinispirillales bacterium]|jgi:glycosyltransferase involved in cell wall biosynthesis|nr:glycosyltransferase family 2 protein [Chitinispirillales bacterium]
MQGKVSMIVPCYNKGKYIGAMLSSVIAQEWDNIELILVNDGSTDETRSIITEYESKIKARGYELVILDQKNAGCCAAVYAGLVRMTGEHFCLVDCDDEIEPKYVSHMAGWLDTHDDYDWAACTYCNVNCLNGTITESHPAKRKYRLDTGNLLEKYILRQTITTAWVYMSRVSYVKKCGLIDNFCLERRKTYEPLMVVPLAFGKGKMEFFNEPLYRYNKTALDLFRFDKFEKCIQYYDDYLYLYDWSINRLDTNDDEKQRLWSIARLAYYRELFSFLPSVDDGYNYKLKVAHGFSDTINELFDPMPNINPEKIVKVDFLPLYKALVHNILDESSIAFQPSSRVIGYGVLGKAAAKIIPLIAGTEWEPTELWDKNGDGTNVKKPDFKSLTCNDTVLIFPKMYSAVKEIQKELDGTPAVILYSQQIDEILPGTLFPQIKNAGLKVNVSVSN